MLGSVDVCEEVLGAPRHTPRLEEIKSLTPEQRAFLHDALAASAQGLMATSDVYAFADASFPPAPKQIRRPSSLGPLVIVSLTYPNVPRRQPSC